MSANITPFKETRLSFNPNKVKYPKLYELYLQHRSLRWTENAFNTSDDMISWRGISTPIKNLILNVLAYFSGSDIIVMDNLEHNMLPDIELLEAKLFYAEQMAAEAVHSIAYGKLLDAFAKPDQLDLLSNSISTIPGIKAKADWAKKWTYSESPIGERLIAYIIVEGIFFSGSFCIIFWLKSKGLMLQALCKSNDWISRDEALHVRFGRALYDMLTGEHRILEKRVHEIFTEAVKIENDFVQEGFDCRLIGMNDQLMSQYIKFCADQILIKMGYNTLYNVENPFAFMNLQGMETKSSFFETKNVDYQVSQNHNTAITFDEDV